MHDRIAGYARHTMEVRLRTEIAESALSQAEGVRSVIAGAGAGGGTDVADRYAALAEDVDRLHEEWAEADDLRQTLVECIDMVADEDSRGVLYAALADAARNGRVSAARLGRRLGVSDKTARKMYDDALVELEEVMRGHGCL